MPRRTKAQIEAENENLRTALEWFFERHLHFECIDDQYCKPCEVAELALGATA